MFSSAGATNATGFAAIKLTALGRPQFLVRPSKIYSCSRCPPVSPHNPENTPFAPIYGVTRAEWVNSLRPSDGIWWQKTWSTLAQVMACCLTAPSHYLSQRWLIMSKVVWLSCEGNFTKDASIINHWNLYENYMSKISFKFPRGQWVKYTSHPQNDACRSCFIRFCWGLVIVSFTCLSFTQ